MIHNAVAEHNVIPHTADDRGVTPGYQRNWTRAHDLNTAALLRFSARERCRLSGTIVLAAGRISCLRGAFSSQLCFTDESGDDYGRGWRLRFVLVVLPLLCVRLRARVMLGSVLAVL